MTRRSNASAEDVHTVLGVLAHPATFESAYTLGSLIGKCVHPHLPHACAHILRLTMCYRNGLTSLYENTSFRGAFAEVKACTDKTTGSEYAAKIFNKKVPSSVLC